MPEYQTQREARLPVKKIDRIDAGLYGRNLVTPLAQLGSCLLRALKILPGHRLLRPKGGLRDGMFGRTRSNSGQKHLFTSCAIGRAEECAHVVHAADVV